MLPTLIALRRTIKKNKKLQFELQLKFARLYWQHQRRQQECEALRNILEERSLNIEAAAAEGDNNPYQEG
eukprot:12933824-Prorocentrum_lima.AAC.1